MSGFEKEELQARMQGTTKEEKQLIAETLPDEILMEEICRRFVDLRETVDSISQAVWGERRQ